jgi:hypothetical protein
VAREVNLGAFRQETLAPPLAATRKSSPATFGAHARAEPVLLFASSFGSLKCAFHKLCCGRRTGLRAGKLGWHAALSMHPVTPDFSMMRIMRIATFTFLK